MEAIPKLLENLESIHTIKGMGSLITILVLGVTVIFCIFKYLVPVVERMHDKSLQAEKESKKHLADLAKIAMEEIKREMMGLKEAVVKLRDELRMVGGK
jgi:abortive infection bacteriophage resistance protein